MRPFGCPVTIINTLDHLGKFDRKSDDGFFLGYSINSKAFRVFNTRTIIVKENLHRTFLENKPNVAGIGPNWMFNIDTFTMSMNYQLVFAGNQTNGNVGTKANINAGQARKKIVPGLQYVMLPLLTSNSQDPRRERAQRNEFESMFEQDKDANGNRTFTPVSAAESTYVNLGRSIPVNAATLPNANLHTDPLMPDLEDTTNL
nr:ribonuclease H-like domain-containing protein [Tanacetum cinerariifolium]